jgi:hypothetical protein
MNTHAQVKQRTSVGRLNNVNPEIQDHEVYISLALNKDNAIIAILNTLKNVPIIQFHKMDVIMKQPAKFIITGTDYTGKSVTKKGAVKVDDMLQSAEIQGNAEPVDVTSETEEDISINLDKQFSQLGYIESLEYATKAQTKVPGTEIATFNERVTPMPSKWKNFTKQVLGFKSKGNYLATWDAKMVEFWKLQEDGTITIVESGVIKFDDELTFLDVVFIEDKTDSSIVSLAASFISEEKVTIYGVLY